MARPILLSWTILMILARPLGLSATGGGFQSPPEWTTDRRLTAGPGDPGLSFNFARTIAADQHGGVHVVWFDTRNGVAQIYYKQSIDGGRTWSSDIPLSQSLKGAMHPTIAADGPDLYVDTRLTRAAGVSVRPSLAIGDDRTLHVAWFDGRNGALEIYYKASRDEGDSWDPDLRLTVAPGDSELPSVAVSGRAVHVAWLDRRSGEPELYYKRKER